MPLNEHLGASSAFLCCSTFVSEGDSDELRGRTRHLFKRKLHHFADSLSFIKKSLEQQ
jgi:hypothetical protein